LGWLDILRDFHSFGRSCSVEESEDHCDHESDDREDESCESSIRVQKVLGCGGYGCDDHCLCDEDWRGENSLDLVLSYGVDDRDGAGLNLVLVGIVVGGVAVIAGVAVPVATVVVAVPTIAVAVARVPVAAAPTLGVDWLSHC